MTFAILISVVGLLPAKSVVTYKLWITSFTLEFIDERNAATRAGDMMKINYYQKLVKQSARADRRAWL